MKDKNGIEVCCENCNDDVAINCPHYNPDNPDEDWGCVVSGGFTPSYDALFARIAELQRHEQSHLEDFTIEEIDFVKKAISMAIIDCETNPPKPSDEKLKLMWSIKSKCDALLKANVRENRTVEESEEMSTQSTDVCDVSKNSKNSTESEEK